MTGEEARRRFGASPVARLATVTPAGRPHLVPVVFALVDDTVYHGVDAKPKRHAALRRLANLDANPAAALLVDHYTADWSRLWWVRADGVARTVEPSSAEATQALELLVARYPGYRLTGRLVAVDVTRWTGWSAAPPG